MSQKIAFISGCDANYFPILLEWIHSIRRFEGSKNAEICILDAGLTTEQIDFLGSFKGHDGAAQIAHIINPDWPTDIPTHKIRGREYLKGCVCRPFLPEIFPGYETYIWMDADTWLQDWSTIELYIKGAQRGKLAITSQSDRAFHNALRVKWLGNLALPLKVRSFYYSNALKAYGPKFARQMLPFAVLNAGSFALRGDAPHWKRWQELVIETVRKGKVFTAEQLSLGILTYLENYPAEVLPAWTQWMNLKEHPPLWDEAHNWFKEPYLPHNPIGIMHLCGMDKERLNRTITHTIKDVHQSEKTFEKSFRYPYYDGQGRKELS